MKKLFVLMTPNALVSVAFADRDDGSVFSVLYQVAAKVLRHLLDGPLANFAFQLTDSGG